MDWANEKYVRLFTRDTVTWKMLPWQARALLPLILRKLDRSGVLDLGEYGEGAIAAIAEVPIEFVQAGLPALLKAKVFAMDAGRLTMPNYIPAQETRQSDAQRKRDSREKRAAGGDNQSPPVTSGHQLSPEVTPTPDLPQDLPQTKTDPIARACEPPANEPGKPSARLVLTKFGAIRAEVLNASDRYWQPSGTAVDKAANWLADMRDDAVADIDPAIRLACAKVRDGAEGWTGSGFSDANFLLGALIAKWSSLREELHGCAPKLARLKEKPIHVGEKSRLWE